jgi:alpha-D-ribose 1-methylphosphonate 5-triphosphate synthase subunit PhnL
MHRKHSAREQGMNLTLEQPTLALDAGEVVTLDDASGSRISARLGSVWVTFEGSTKDVILGPGESVIVTRDGRTVVQALRQSFVTIQ